MDAPARILITGGTGYIGSYLVRAALRTGISVDLAVRDPDRMGLIDDLRGAVRAHAADLANPRDVDAVFRAVRPDVVWHCATFGARRSQTADDLLVRNTCLALTHVVAAARRSDAFIVHAGSSAEYDPRSTAPAESAPLAPARPYGAAKAFETLYLSSSYERACVLRLFPTYGPVVDEIRVLPTIVAAYLREAAPVLDHAETARDFVHLEDVFRAFVSATDRRLPGTFNIGSGELQTLGEIASYVAARLGSSLVPTWTGAVPLAGQRADCDSARRMLGWQPQKTFRTGLDEMISYFRTREPSLAPGTSRPQLRTILSRDPERVGSRV